MTAKKIAAAVVFSFMAIPAHAGPIDLGTAAGFAVLAGSTVTNTGSTTISGNVGVAPGSAVSGFPPGLIGGGTIHANDQVAMQAKADVTTAYNAAAAQTGGVVLTGQDLGGLVLTPGVYFFASSAQLTGTLTLNAQGNPNADFVFQIGSTLTTASASQVDFINSGQGDSVFWQVGSSAILGTGTAFAGNILAQTSITLNSTATITCGRALAESGAVTLDTNTVSINSAGCGAVVAGTSVPEPSSVALLAAGLLALFSVVKLPRLCQPRLRQTGPSQNWRSNRSI